MNAEVGDPREVGRWEPIRARFHYLPVHMALLHTGRVLAFGGSGNYPPDLKHPHRAEIWDPKEGGDAREVGEALPSDVFCSGHAFLPDGRLLVSGGTRLYDRLRFGVGVPPFRGSDRSYVFDPTTEEWESLPNMQRGRWYPTLVGLPDGAVLAMSGLAKHFPWYFRRSAETFETPETQWQPRRAAGRWLPLYPRLHLVPGAGQRAGGVFYAGSFNTHYTYPFKLKSFPSAMLSFDTWSWRKFGLPRYPQREEGTSILMPLMPPEYRSQVMLIGGGSFLGKKVTPQVEVVDLSIENPVWEEHPATMLHSRYYPYTVILPDRHLLVVGGRKGRGDHGHAPPSPMPGHPDPSPMEPHPDPDAIHESEAFDPQAQLWKPMASMTKDRLYHSNAILLPDGRVMVAGSNIHRGTNELTIELYSPPYLFHGDRPSIEHAPKQIQHAATFEIRTPNAKSISEVALMRPSATTHCVDTEQRYVGLRFRATSDAVISAEVPADPFIAPPGYYMLFVLREGIPSEAAFLQLA